MVHGCAYSSNMVGMRLHGKGAWKVSGVMCGMGINKLYGML